MEHLQGIPDILFKYRDFSNPFHKKLLFESELYFASFDQFNDPFDGTVPFRYDESQLTAENIFKKYYSMTKEQNPTWSESQIHDHCFEFQRRGLLKDDRHIERFQEDTKRQLNNIMGIVSLTSQSNNFLMWSHYSNSHTGFVVGLDKQLLYEQAIAAIKPVNYENDLPLIDLFDTPESIFSKLICTKSKVWEYENEIRLHKSHFSRKTLSLHKDTFVEFIFGCKMNHSTKLKLIEFIAKTYPNAKVFETQLNKKQFVLELFPLR